MDLVTKSIQAQCPFNVLILNYNTSTQTGEPPYKVLFGAIWCQFTICCASGTKPCLSASEGSSSSQKSETSPNSYNRNKCLSKSLSDYKLVQRRNNFGPFLPSSFSNISNNFKFCHKTNKRCQIWRKQWFDDWVRSCSGGGAYLITWMNTNLAQNTKEWMHIIMIIITGLKGDLQSWNCCLLWALGERSRGSVTSLLIFTVRLCQQAVAYELARFVNSSSCILLDRFGGPTGVAMHCWEYLYQVSPSSLFICDKDRWLSVSQLSLHCPIITPASWHVHLQHFWDGIRFEWGVGGNVTVPLFLIS